MITRDAKKMLVDNLYFFRKYYPSLYSLMQGQEPDRERYRTRQARKAEISTIEKMERERWVAVHSVYDPLQEAVRWAQTALKEETTEVVLFGLGFGYYVEALLAINPKLRFYILEPDIEVFLHSLEVRDWTHFPWEQIVYLRLGQGDQALHDVHQAYFTRVHPKLQLLELPAYTRIYEDVYRRFTKTLRQERKDYVENMASTLYFQKMWARNAVKNIAKVTDTPSIFSLSHLFKNRVVILAASGSSLADSIPAIRKAQAEQKALVIAAGTSVNSLLKQGITPDAFVSYDPNDPNYHVLRPVFQSSIPLIFASTIHYKIVQEYQGPMAHFITTQDYIYRYLDKRFDARHMIADAPTVTLIAMQLLLKMECKAIYLAGQDLASIGKKTYAEGTSAHHDAVNTDASSVFKQVLTVENNQGEQAETNQSFIRMKKSIEQFFHNCPADNIFNLSKYGAKLEGIPYKPLEELMDVLERESVVPFRFTLPEVNPKKRKKFLVVLHKDIRSCSQDICHLDALLQRMQKDDGLQPGKREKMVQEYNELVDRFLAKPAFIGLFYPWMQVYLQNMQRMIYEIKDLSFAKQFPTVRDLLVGFVRESKAALEFYKENFKETE